MLTDLYRVLRYDSKDKKKRIQEITYTYRNLFLFVDLYLIIIRCSYKKQQFLKNYQYISVHLHYARCWQMSYSTIYYNFVRSIPTDDSPY